MQLRTLLASFEAVLAFFEGLNQDHHVRLAIQPDAVDIVVEPPKAEATVEAHEEDADEQKEGQ